MGGSVVRIEPISPRKICRDSIVVSIFIEQGWMEYFDHLQGFDKDITLEFSQELQADVKW